MRAPTALRLGAMLAIACGAFGCSRARVPDVNSPAYVDTTRDFCRGLAELEVGLLDDAKRDFGKATDLAPGEPAAWANLGLAHLRLGEFDAANTPIDKAVSLDPKSSDLVFLRGRLRTSQGKLDEGIADYQRAADLDPNNMRVRYALAEEVERAGGANADADAERLFGDILKAKPGNVAVVLERARVAAKRGDAAVLRDSLRTLEPMAAAWPAAAVEQFRGLQAAVAANNFQDAARSVAFLRNVLVRDVTFRENLAAVHTPTELIAEPFETFLKMPSPSSKPSPIDEGLTFTRELTTEEPRFPPQTLFLDWNRDFKMDYVVPAPDGRGVRVFVQQADGSYKDATPTRDGYTESVSKLWAADIDMDGDLDIVVAPDRFPPFVLRNNGDGTWKQIRPFTGVAMLAGFAWGDLDGDGDPDAVLLDADGQVHVFENRQGGEFREWPKPPALRQVSGVAVGDLNGDGVLELITIDSNGAIQSTALREGEWKTTQVASWPGFDGVHGEVILLGDLDNNGTLDVVISTTDYASTARAWLFDESHIARPFDIPGLMPNTSITSITDVNGDGQPDLVGTVIDTESHRPRVVRFLGKGTKGYHWQVLRPQAQPTAGDQRINSFGVGGDIEIRSGLLTQKQMITGQPVHFGLGTRTQVDVARIFWPNGIMQADFDVKADQSIVAEQRLKGSCPWVFTYDGHGMQFVTDFLWRSPLGLRINAVDTAGVTQTEDWIKIRGDQLVARDGVYDVRITAELWETHFVDHVSLMVVDHPADQDVFVDERFAREAPSLAVHALTRLRPVARAWDDAGRDVTDLIESRDGRYLATFELGEYQGIAKDHFVEIDLGDADGRPTVQHDSNGRWLVANGWIYPTDSSINVAIGQQQIQPHGIALEAQDARG
ncbi:MAG TPA: FG-GAP-like repeat-containing protein, partial [Vicinamibacterales bacterium]|nr:FG-GAP-like repeat-containing protein [Vicinamibacterales bacterium]